MRGHSQDVLILISNDSERVSGQTIPVDGNAARLLNYKLLINSGAIFFDFAENLFFNSL